MSIRQELAQAERRWGQGRRRLIRFWQIVIYGTTLLNAGALWRRDSAMLQGWSLALVAGLVLAYLLAFELVAMNPRLAPLSPRLSASYIALQTAIYALLSLWSQSFVGLGFALLGQAAMLLPPRLWIYPMLPTMLLIGQSWGLFASFLSGDWFAMGDLLILVAIFTGLFMSSEFVTRQRAKAQALLEQVQQAREEAEALAAQNAELAAARQQTIAELEATRRDLTAAEYAAGVLEERQRLAHDIHDTLAQEFTSMVMHLEAAGPDLAGLAPVAREHLDQARYSARAGLNEARRLVWALRPEALDQASLPEALQRLARAWSAASGVAATAQVTGTPQPLPMQIEVTLLRVAQETLANVRKHARASAVILTLSFMEDTLLLDVQDDGVGFDSAALPDAHCDGGYGLTSMRERVAQIGGLLSVESAPGEGTTVVVQVPAG